MTSLPDRSDRRRLSKLEAAVHSKDLALLAARADLEGAQGNLTALRERLEREESKRPPDTVDPAEEAAAAALMANPQAPTAPFLDRLLGPMKKRTESVDTWQASLATIRRAIAGTEREIERREREIADLEAERAAAWRAFATAAYPALLAELERRLSVIHDELYAPMVALEGDAAISGDMERLQRPLVVQAYSYPGNQTLNLRHRVLFPKRETRTRRFDQPPPRTVRIPVRDPATGEIVKDEATGEPTYREQTFQNEARSPLTTIGDVDPAPYLDKLRAELRAERG